MRRLPPTFLVVVAIALAVRLAVAVAHEDPVRRDAADYHRHAVSIARGDGYPETQVAGKRGPTALRPPAFPVFLGGIYTVTGPRPLAGRIGQALVGTAIVFLLGVLARRLWNEKAALASAGIAAVFPPLIVAGASLLVEPLFIAFVLGALLAACAYRSSRRLAWVAVAGVLVGLAVLTRVNGFVLLLPLVVAVWGGRRRLSRVEAVAPLVLVASVGATLLPWTLRNAVVMDAFLPLGTQAGFNLAGTYSDEAMADSRYVGAWRPPVRTAVAIGAARLNETELGHALTAVALDHARAHPEYVGIAGIHNAGRLLHLEDVSHSRFSVAIATGVGRGVADAAIVSFYIIAGLALLGATTNAARKTPLFVWLTPVVLFASVVFIHAGTRFRFPVDPFLIALAGLGLSSLWSRFERGPMRER